MFDEIIFYIKESYGRPGGNIPLHAPSFNGNEKKYVLDCIDSTYVSSVGSYVDKLEQKIAEFTRTKYAIATVNGTAALHVSLLLAGVKSDHEVLTQAVSFVATANAIAYCGAEPIFLDSDKNTFGLSPVALEDFLSQNAESRKDGYTYNKATGRRISACVPMHVFGHPTKIDRIKSLCDIYNIVLVEDAAESLGSLYQKKHTGTFGRLGILSFNGNKIITTGGGGMILTDDGNLARMAKHLTTTAKVPHPWEYVHDKIGYNSRMPDINAALGCAQMESLPDLLGRKRKQATAYRDFFEEVGITFVSEPEDCRSNYWLNTILFKDFTQREAFLRYANENGVMARPLWNLLSTLPIYRHCQTDRLTNAKWLWERAVNIPSGVVR